MGLSYREVLEHRSEKNLGQSESHVSRVSSVEFTTTRLNRAEWVVFFTHPEEPKAYCRVEKRGLALRLRVRLIDNGVVSRQ